MGCWNELLEAILRSGEIVIYGAGVMGRAVKHCLEDAPYYVHVKAFIVESLKNNPDNINDVPIVDIAHASLYRETLVIVALHEKNIKGVLRQLSENGFRYVKPLSFDSDDWSDIRGNWFRYSKSEGQEPYIDLNEMYANKFRIFVVNSISDRMLSEKVKERNFEIPIQVGASLTNKRIAMVTDNQGDNISEKNKKYCELTALYWIWKNDSTKYVGLSHYRRRFDISESMAAWLPESGIDAVLTVPVLNLVGVRKQYCKDHCESDWNIMMESIGCLSPQYLRIAEKVEKGNYYYAYNMFIARREILNRYCEWLFPILFRCEDEIGEKQDIYQGRYIGFLAERLITVFFEYHRKEYKVAIAKKHFITGQEFI